MKMTDFWAKEARDIVSTEVLGTEVLEPTTIENEGIEDVINLKIGILSGFYIGAGTAANLEIARKDIQNLINPAVRDFLVLRFTKQNELPFLEKVEFYYSYRDSGDIRLDNSEMWDYLSEDSVHFLLHNLCFGRQGYLYQISKTAFAITVPANRFETLKTHVAALDSADDNGLANYSTTQRDLLKRSDWPLVANSSVRKPIALGESIEKDNTYFDAIISFHPTARWYLDNAATMEKSRSSVLFHELWESWERTTNLLPYVYPQFDGRGFAITDSRNPLENVETDKSDELKYGAHRNAVNAEYNFWDQSTMPGDFRVVRF